MSFSPYKSTQIDAAACLLELFCPPEQSLDKILAVFADALEDIVKESKKGYTKTYGILKRLQTNDIRQAGIRS